MEKLKNEKIEKNENIDINKIVANINQSIIDKLNNGTKKEITARDCLLSVSYLEKLNEIYTTKDKKDLSEILTHCLSFEENENDFKIILNNNIKNQINDIIFKIVKFDILTNSEYKKILYFALVSLFGFKFAKKDKTNNLFSWVIKRKSITINQFVIAFLQSYCYVKNMQIVCDGQNVYIVNIDDFNKIKYDAYKTYNNAIIENLKK